MKGDRTLDQVLDDLRQPAGVSELVGQSEAVAAISNALRSASAPPINAPKSPPGLRVATFVAAGVIGFGSAAAAGPALFETVIGGDEPQLTTPTATTEPTDQSSEFAAVDGDLVDEDSDASTTDQVSDDPATTFDETACADGNHGQTVNSIARATPSEPGKGHIVAEAAQSTCGKDLESDDAPAADQVSDDPATTFDETACADGNHGQTVNSIARATPSEPGKGHIVAEAAQSTCGKDHESDSGPVVATGSGDEDGDELGNRADAKPDNQPDNQPDQRGRAEQPGNQPDQRGRADTKADLKPTTKKSTND